MMSVAAILTIVTVLLAHGIKLFDSLIEFSNNPYYDFMYRILIVVPSILVGIGFLTIKNFQKELAMIAGITQILAGISDLFLGIFGIMAGAIALILQIIYL